MIAVATAEPVAEKEGGTMDREDAAAIERYLRSRDEASFRALYRAHTPVMYRFALARLRAPDAAENVVQEAWLRAVRGLESFNGRSSLRSWLVGIVRNCCHEHWRSTAGSGSESIDDEPRRGTTGNGPSASLQRLDLERCVQKLPEGARTILLLHDVEGFTHAEIADSLGIDAGTSKSQLHRARKLLRRALSTGRRQS